MSAAERVAATPLPVLRAADLPATPQRQPWLIERLWAEQAVGVVGGAPKCGKTWLALELAVAVASGRDALGQFAVLTPGPVLVYGVLSPT
jgi:RecA-family ATPase